MWVARQLKKIALTKKEDDKPIQLGSGMKKLLSILNNEVDSSTNAEQLIEDGRDLSGPR